MNKEEILQRYYKEKDEGVIFIQSKALIKGFSLTVLLAMILMIMSFLLTKDSTIADIIFILLLPFVISCYASKAYYLKNKTYFFVTVCWILIYVLRFIDFIQVIF